MFSKTILPVAILAVAAAAAPLEARQYQTSASCSDSTSYSVDSETKHISDWTAVSGQACTSSNEDSCTVGAQASVSLGVTITVGGGLNLGDIFHVDSSVAFSYTETKGQSVGETCPKGGYVCGLMYQNGLVDVKGKKTKTYVGNCALNGQKESEDEYAFTAPAMIGDSPQITFAACISHSSPKKDTEATGIAMCPGDL